MLLIIDSGNTDIVFAIYKGKEIRCKWRCSTATKRTSEEYAVWLNQLMSIEKIKFNDIRSTIISNVVPSIQKDFILLCEKYMKSAPIVVGERGVDVGLDILTLHPEEVGADRIANTAAIKFRYSYPAIVVDFGTATTFDIVDSKGNYAGGIIAPGINLSLESLYNAAAKLPKITIQKPSQVIGRSTVTAMQSGIFWGYVSMIDGLLQKIHDDMNENFSIVSTGGLAKLFSSTIKAIKKYKPNLTLEGLYEIHELNKEKDEPKS
ncbi:MAG: type III pantothenate kinase [Alphaproteobacteria bacterium]|nr:type III pantothenate kinase [Alphaproteobacteria bacterium]|tara:strand:+ start:999 stop:1787 length:789 start_codon:yes stop_codon:yes gene_type:complete